MRWKSTGSKNAPVGRPWHAPEPEKFRLLSQETPYIADIFRCKSLIRSDGTRQPLDVYVPQLEGDLLYSLVRYLEPHATLEVGLANGISALHIAKALQDNGGGQHFVMDPLQFQEWHGVGLHSLERAGLKEWVTLDPRCSHLALASLEEAGQRVQFAFIDGSHLFEDVLVDFRGVDRLLDVGGLVAFDDSDWPSISKVIRFAVTNRDYAVFETGIVIEPGRYRPRWLSRWARTLSHRFPSLQRVLRPEFLVPNHFLGITGRCVVLQKTGADERDNQQPHFQEF